VAIFIHAESIDSGPAAASDLSFITHLADSIRVETITTQGGLGAGSVGLRLRWLQAAPKPAALKELGDQREN
jgi:hypothetical protein